MTCAECNRDVPAFQCAYWSCSCGVEIATCFTCNYQAYAVVDGFRKEHECADREMETMDPAAAMERIEEMFLHRKPQARDTK